MPRSLTSRLTRVTLPLLALLLTHSLAREIDHSASAAT